MSKQMMLAVASQGRRTLDSREPMRRTAPQKTGTAPETFAQMNLPETPAKQPKVAGSRWVGGQFNRLRPKLNLPNLRSQPSTSKTGEASQPSVPTTPPAPSQSSAQPAPPTPSKSSAPTELPGGIK
jgi:hypothetical protein